MRMNINITCVMHLYTNLPTDALDALDKLFYQIDDEPSHWAAIVPVALANFGQISLSSTAQGVSQL